MAEPKFEEFLKEREQNQKQMQMENLMKEFEERKRREKVMEQKQMASMEFGSFKDFIESTGDEELMDLYLEGLKLKDMSKLEKRLKEKGYQPGEYAMGGSVGKPLGPGGKR